MGSFEYFKRKTHFNSLKLLAVALATAAGGGTPLDLLARVPPSVADLGAAPLVAGITLAIASRVEPMALLAAPVALAAVASGAGTGWLLIDWDAIRLPTAITTPRRRRSARAPR